MMNKDKKYCMAKSVAKREHERLVPELKRAGLKKEAKEQQADLNKINKL